jgi:hypothetical protein
MKGIPYRMMLLLAVLFTACEEDPALDSQYKPIVHLDDFLAVQDTSGIRSPRLIFASDFATNEASIDLFVYSENKLESFVVFRSDTLQFKDSNELYKPRLSLYHDQEGKLHRIAVPIQATDHFLRLFYQTEKETFLSAPISIRQATLNTDTIGSGDIDLIEASDGFLDFQWPSVPASEFYFIQLFNEQGDAFMQLTLDRTQFSFYDLRWVKENFTSDLRDPELIPGKPYVFQVDAIGTQGWHLAHGTKAFIAP